MMAGMEKQSVLRAQRCTDMIRYIPISKLKRKTIQRPFDSLNRQEENTRAFVIEMAFLPLERKMNHLKTRS